MGGNSEGGVANHVLWELIVKPGVKKIAMDRSKEINKDKRGVLNLLLLRQAYLIKKIQNTRL